MTIEELRKKSFKELSIFESIESSIFILKRLLHAENVIVWFDDSNNIWSYIKNKKVSISREVLNKSLHEKATNFLIRENNPSIFRELESTNIHSEKAIENILFHALTLENNFYLYIECVNIFGFNGFTNSLYDTLNIVSLYLTQHIEMCAVRELSQYYYEEQKKAYIKQKTILHNDLANSKNYNVSIFYKPSDILSGDSYSIYQTSNGDILIYLLDAMGHGITPSLTAYSVSAIIQQKIKTNPTFNVLMTDLIDNLQYILTDEEQLTCGFFWFSHDLKKVDYVVAGMYAPQLLDGEKMISIKSNNIPFMNFTFDFKISTIQIANFQKFFAYTDGLVEDSKENIFNIENMVKNDTYCKSVLDELSFRHLEDDTTIIKFQKNSCLI